MTPATEAIAPQRGPLWGLALVSVVGILAVTLSAVADVTAYLAHAQANRDYRPVEATVIQAQSLPIGTRTSEVSADTTRVVPVITYRYVVDGRTFESSERTYSGDMGTWSPASAAQEVQRHPAGSKQQVYYDPAFPSQSFLEKTPPQLDGMGLAADGLLIAVGLVTLISALRGRLPLARR